MKHESGDEPRRGGQPPIGDYAVIGDCRTMALVSKAAAIDWLCLPRFDGGSVFAAVLDEERGGCFSVQPVGAFSSSRRYLADTNVLETTFDTPRGVIRLTDLMPVHDPGWDGGHLRPDHEILRRIECVEGEVKVRILCDPRFDYGTRVAVHPPRGQRPSRA
jgi:GH15 family glucan-1,4-alpha-glucosidase